MLAYDMSIRQRGKKAEMGVPQDEWIGDADDYTEDQKISICFGWIRALLAVDSQ